MIRVGIVGASGYTAIECIELLIRHPQAEIVVATSRQGDGSSIANLHPQLADRLHINVEDLNAEQIAERCDVAFTCLPHGASAQFVCELLSHDCKVIDLSADFRLSTPDLYHRWYGESHPAPSRLGATPYGLPELFESDLQGQSLIANPGCYPTSAILPLAPLVQAKLIDCDTVIVDSKSGISGAGRTPKQNTLYCESAESISAYAIGTHRHQPEISDIVQRFAGRCPKIVFTPHLTPMERGILSTIYFENTLNCSANQVRDLLAQFYEDHPFVRVVGHLPSTRFVSRTNFCDIAVRENDGYLVLISAIDNLTKGASGAAVQNMNIMFGQPQTMGLIP